MKAAIQGLRVTCGFLVLSLLAVFLVGSPGMAAPVAREPFQVMLRAGSFRPAALAAADLSSRLGELFRDAPPEGTAHALLQLQDRTSPRSRGELERRGIRFLSYLPHDTWLVSLPGDLPPAALTGHVRWLGPIEPAWKTAPRLLTRGVAPWSRPSGGEAFLIVKLMPDVPLSRGADLLEGWGAEVLAEIPISHGFRVAGPEALIGLLSEQDEVLFVSDLPPPKVEDNDGSRANAGADEVQEPPFELSGSGVDLAIWDSGTVDENHDDFAGRISMADLTNTSSHGTHVAGTMAGSGELSEAHGGDPLQWRGMAPGAGIISFDWDDFLLEFNEAIYTYGADLSQNSWGFGISEGWGNCDDYGDYSDGTPELDDIITGSLGTPIVIVFSAGNERDDGDCGVPERGGYACIGPLKTGKNVITVGAIYSDTDGMTDFSSWGPVDDGRLKPDLVASGCEEGGEGYIKSTLPGDIYGAPGYCGTSMAAPAVSGCAALLMELWPTVYPGAGLPLPGTVKAFLVGTARDLGNPGPDYSYGHGALNVSRAAHLMVSAGAWVDTVAASEVDEISFLVSAADPPESLRVTLVWDDPPGLELADPALVNDLDLVLEDPQGGLHYPWILNPADPSAPATRGPDHLNNVEEILVVSPSPGNWHAWITGTDVPEGPQEYTVVGIDRMGPPSLPFFNATAPVENEAHIRWLVPETVDYTGTVIVRSASPIGWAPAPGESYAVDEEVAPGVIVRYVGSGDHSVSPLVDYGLDGGIVYHYGGTNFDDWFNYSAVVTDTAYVEGGVVPRVSGVDPPPYALAVAETAHAVATFSTEMDSTSVDSTTAFLVGDWSGPRGAQLTLSGEGTVLDLAPSTPFMSGEGVRVTLSGRLTSVSAAWLTGGFQWVYRTRVVGTGTGDMTLGSSGDVGSSPLAIAAADLSGDGAVDLAITGGTRQLRIYLNQGDGTFSLDGTYNTGVDPLSVKPGDLDGDGHTDLVVANLGDGSYRVYMGDGTGAFTAYGAVGVAGSPDDAGLADLDGDGMLDLLLALGEQGDLMAAPGLGNGSFGAGVYIPVGGRPEAMEIIDLDNDGVVDVVLTSTTTNELLTVRNYGHWTLVPVGSYGTGSLPARLVAEDFTGDGQADVAVLDRSDGTVSLFEGKADGSFHDRVIHALGSSPWDLGAGDLDGDGDVDILATRRTSGAWALLRNGGVGDFAEVENMAAGSQPKRMALLDAEGDGDIDGALLRGLTGTLAIYLNKPGTDVAELAGDAWRGPLLSPVAPNPLNPGARLSFYLPSRSQATLSIFDSRGRLVRCLAEGMHEAGRHEILWSGIDREGCPVASGVYFLLLEAGGARQGQKLVVVK